MIGQLQTELKELSDAAGFTRSDLAVWLEFDKSAVREWIKNGVHPHPVKEKYIKKRLAILRAAIEKMQQPIKNMQLPVPVTVNQYERKQYVIQVRYYALREFSKAGASE